MTGRAEVVEYVVRWLEFTLPPGPVDRDDVLGGLRRLAARLANDDRSKEE